MSNPSSLPATSPAKVSTLEPQTVDPNPAPVDKEPSRLYPLQVEDDRPPTVKEAEEILTNWLEIK